MATTRAISCYGLPLPLPYLCPGSLYALDMAIKKAFVAAGIVFPRWAAGRQSKRGEVGALLERQAVYGRGKRGSAQERAKGCGLPVLADATWVRGTCCKKCGLV